MTKRYELAPEITIREGQWFGVTWSPADSAPRDGSHILVTNLNGRGFGICGVGFRGRRWQDWCAVVHYWGNPGEEGFYLSSGASLPTDDRPVEFTHWMPLPSESQQAELVAAVASLAPLSETPSGEAVRGAFDETPDTIWRCHLCGLTFPAQTQREADDRHAYGNTNCPGNGQMVELNPLVTQGQRSLAFPKRERSLAGAAPVAPLSEPVTRTHTSDNPKMITDAQIKHMVERFLAWRLPEDFQPDCGISFEREHSVNAPWGPQKHQPIGTNLFTASQAEAMIRYLVEGMPSIAPLSETPSEPGAALQRIALLADSESATNDPYGTLEKISRAAWAAIEPASATPQSETETTSQSTPSSSQTGSSADSELWEERTRLRLALFTMAYALDYRDAWTDASKEAFSRALLPFGSAVTPQSETGKP